MWLTLLSDQVQLTLVYAENFPPKLNSASCNRYKQQSYQSPCSGNTSFPRSSPSEFDRLLKVHIFKIFIFYLKKYIIKPYLPDIFRHKSGSATVQKTLKSSTRWHEKDILPSFSLPVTTHIVRLRCHISMVTGALGILFFNVVFLFHGSPVNVVRWIKSIVMNNNDGCSSLGTENEYSKS